METIEIWIGSIQSTSGGRTEDNTRLVQFEGEKVAEHTFLGEDRNGNLIDTRGTTRTLYKTPDGRLIVHQKEWSQWQGEPTTYVLYEVSEKDLGPTGPFGALGREAGYGRPLALDEAISPTWWKIDKEGEV